jgi:hypothetical protein
MQVLCGFSGEFTSGNMASVVAEMVLNSQPCGRMQRRFGLLMTLSFSASVAVK